MKTTRIIFQIILSFVLMFSFVFFANNKLDQEFYVYNTIFEYDAFSKHALVLNRETKNVKFQKDADTRAYPASLTKIMSTIVAIENIDDIEEVVPIDSETYYEMLNKNASMAGFAINEKVTFNDLLHATMLSSGGEAVNSLAVNVAGSIDAFVVLMNEKAENLNLSNTHFTSAEGLDDSNQYTSAKDMALLLDYALDNIHFKDLITKLNYQTSKTAHHPNGITLTSTVLSLIDTDQQTDFLIIGGKSGTTWAAGYNWVTLGIKNNVEYISVVMGASIGKIDREDGKHIEDTINIFKLINESTD